MTVRRGLTAVVTTLAMALATVGVTAPAAGAAPPTYCHDATFGGTYICAYGRRFHTFSDGALEIFVIGTNFAVYTRWRNASGNLSGWLSLGGQILHSYSESDFYLMWCPGEPALKVYVRGTNGSIYHRSRFASGRWSDWVFGSGICFT